MPDFARVLNGSVLEGRAFDGSAPSLAPNKGAWLPVLQDAPPTYDATTQTLVATVTVSADHVQHGFTVQDLPLEDVKAAQHAAREAAVADKLAAGYESGGLHVQIDAGSRANLTAMGATAALVLLGTPGLTWPTDYARGWVTSEGDRIALGQPADGLTLANAAGLYYSALIQHDQDLADAIDAASDAAAVLAVDVGAGWP